MIEVAVVLRSKVFPVSLSVTLTIYTDKMPFRRRAGGVSHSRLMLEWSMANPLKFVGATVGAEKIASMIVTLLHHVI